MKQTHRYYDQADIEKLGELLLLKKILDEKVRINLYIPKIVVKLIDLLGKDNSRGEFVTSLVIKEVKKRKKLPHAIFSPLEISQKEIKEISQQWEKSVNVAL